MQRILEEDLQLPALYLISLQNGHITTSKLSTQLRSLLNPKGKDLDILDGRSDDKFSQIVRNLTGYQRSFVQNGYINREHGRNKPLFIGPNGIRLLEEKGGLLDYLFNNDFSFQDLIDSLKDIQSSEKENHHVELFDENVTINEGTQTIQNTKVYERSKKLRDQAIKYYKTDDKIKCHACCFDFENFYGEYGKDFIEIHHEKPVYQYNGDDIEKTITDALENVKPICPNCHRMIHRRRKNLLTLKELRDLISKDLDFCKDEN